MDKQIEAFRNGKLQPGEEIEAVISGFVEGASAFQGRLILTNRRICFYRRGITGETFETIPLDKVTSVEAKSTLGIRKLRVHTSHDKMSFQVAGEKAAFDAFYSKLEALRHVPNAIPSSSNATDTTGASSSLVDQLRELGSLREQGVLTEDEFSAFKAKLLG